MHTRENIHASIICMAANYFFFEIKNWYIWNPPTEMYKVVNIRLLKDERKTQHLFHLDSLLFFFFFHDWYYLTTWRKVCCIDNVFCWCTRSLYTFFISRHINHRLLLASNKPPCRQDFVIARSTSRHSGRLTNITSKDIKRTDSGCKELLGMWPVINQDYVVARSTFCFS